MRSTTSCGRVGDLTPPRRGRGCSTASTPARCSRSCARERRAVTIRLGGEERWIDAADAGLYRDALGVAPPGGLPTAFLEDVPDALVAAGQALRRHPRPVHDSPSCARATAWTLGGAARARARRHAGARRASPRRLGARVVRPRGAAPAAASVAGGAPQGGRAGRPARAGALPPRLAGRRPSLGVGRRHRPAAGGARPAAGTGAARGCWERDVLPRRVGAYSPSWMDQLCASGELVWIGAGALGRNSGRVALYFREDLAELGPPQLRGAARASPISSRARRGPRAAGGRSCFFTDLLADVDLAAEELQEALWDLVWAGEATNDAFAPLRAPRLTLARAQRDRVRGAARRGGPVRLAPPRGGAAAQVQGRWSLTEPLFRGQVDPSRAGARSAELLLERYGVLTREQVLAEGIAGGFSAIYSELSAARDARRRPPRLLRRRPRWRAVRAAGRGRTAAGAEAFRGAAARARRRRPGPALRRRAALAGARRRRGLAAAGAGRGRPRRADRRPSRSLYLERAGRALQTLVAADDPRLQPALAALVERVRSGQIKRLALESVDGEPAMSSALGPALVALGFQEGPRRLTLTA